MNIKKNVLKSSSQLLKETLLIFKKLFPLLALFNFVLVVGLFCFSIMLFVVDMSERLSVPLFILMLSSFLFVFIFLIIMFFLLFVIINNREKVSLLFFVNIFKQKFYSFFAIYFTVSIVFLFVIFVNPFHLLFLFLWLFPLLVFAGWPIIHEDYNSLSAIERVRELSSKYLMQILKKILIFFFILILISGLLIYFFVFLNSNPLWLYLAGYVYVVVLQFFVIYSYLIYENLIALGEPSKIINKNKDIVLRNIFIPIIIIILFIIIFIFGFSDPKELDRDFSRVSDIEKIQFNLESYYSLNKIYPDNILELKNMKFFIDDSEGNILIDPNGLKYEYRNMSGNNYELCFVLEVGYSSYSTGRHCVGMDNRVYLDFRK